MADEQTNPLADTRAAQPPACDHHWVTRMRPPLAARICSLCGEIDWADLAAVVRASGAGMGGISRATDACRWCGGTDGEHDGAMHDAVAATGTPAYWKPDQRPDPAPDDTADLPAEVDILDLITDLDAMRARVRAVMHALRVEQAKHRAARADLAALREGVETVLDAWAAGRSHEPTHPAYVKLRALLAAHREHDG